MAKRIVRLENWSVVSRVIFDGYRNLEPGQRLTGDVLGHANLRNGVIYTSAILNVDRLSRMVETRNTIYELGQVAPEYEQWLAGQEGARAA